MNEGLDEESTKIQAVLGRASSEFQPVPLPPDWPLFSEHHWRDCWGRWPWMIGGILRCEPPWVGKNSQDAMRACLRFSMGNHQFLSSTVLSGDVHSLGSSMPELRDDSVCLLFPGVKEPTDRSLVNRARAIEALAFIHLFDHPDLREVQLLTAAPTRERLAQAVSIAGRADWLGPKEAPSSAMKPSEEIVPIRELRRKFEVLTGDGLAPRVFSQMRQGPGPDGGWSVRGMADDLVGKKAAGSTRERVKKAFQDLASAGDGLVESVGECWQLGPEAFIRGPQQGTTGGHSGA